MKRPTDAEVDGWAEGNPGQAILNLWNEVRRARAEEERLRGIIEKAQGDVNWMLNERKFLNPEVLAYLDEAIEEAD